MRKLKKTIQLKALEGIFQGIVESNLSQLEHAKTREVQTSLCYAVSRKDKKP